MKSFAAMAYERLSRGESLVLAKIIRQQGSTPRAAGTQMMVTGDGNAVGTIGGGQLEGRVIARCTELLADGAACFEAYDLDSADMAAMDMICGGGVEVLLDPLAPAPEHIAIFERWSRMAVEGGEGAFVSAILCAEQGRIAHIDHALIEADGRVHGRLPLSDAGRKALVLAVRTITAMVTMSLEDLFMIVEPIRKPLSVYLIGAGHVSQPTAHLAEQVGFRVVVFDDRLAFANRERFPDVHEVRVLADFEHPFDSLAIDTHSFIVIITRGHLYDKVVLSRALRTNAGYIGMIGSLRKREAIFGSLLKEGFSQADLARVHSPIGLDIGAETPAEIAVSIVAEMIRERRKR